MDRQSREPPHLLTTLSMRLHVRLVGKLYALAADERKPVETVVRQALERWLDEREQQKAGSGTKAHGPAGGADRRAR